MSVPLRTYAMCQLCNSWHEMLAPSETPPSRCYACDLAWTKGYAAGVEAAIVKARETFRDDETSHLDSWGCRVVYETTLAAALGRLRDKL